MSEDDFSKFTSPRPNEELHQGSEVPVTFGIDPNDRLPVPVAPDNEDRPPPLAVDTLVCMEDKRSFVIRNSDGSIFASFAVEQVSRSANGEYSVKKELVTDDQYVAIERSGGVVNGAAGPMIVVEPVRPACLHYLRLMTDISADRSRRFLTRSCMAMKSET